MIKRSRNIQDVLHKVRRIKLKSEAIWNLQNKNYAIMQNKKQMFQIKAKSDNTQIVGTMKN